MNRKSVHAFKTPKILLRVLTIALVLEAIILLGTAAAISRDYQDSWILEGLEIPFFTFVVTYVVLASVEERITPIILFALFYRFILLLIPSIKYTWFLGVAVDQHTHYRLFQDIYQNGQVPPIGDLYGPYSSVPLIHISFTIFSLVTSIDGVSAFKILPVLLWFVFPLGIYYIIKSLKLTGNSLLKYALVFSSIPVSTGISLVVTSLLFGALFVFLFLLQLVKILENDDRRHWILALTFIIAIVITQTYSSILLAIILFGLFSCKFMFRPLRVNALRLLRSPLMVTIIVVNLVWLTYVAVDALAQGTFIFSSYLSAMFELGTAKQAIPTRFFALGLIDMFRILLVYHGGDALVLFLTAIGVAVALRKFRSSKSPLVSLALYSMLLFLVLLIQIVTRFGGTELYRVVGFLLIVSPIFSAILLDYLNRKLHSKKLAIFFILALAVLAPLQLYGCQPLLPSANVVSKNLPADQPISYVNSVNSVYQRSMIVHAEKYVLGGTKIASDRTTQNQLMGLTSYAFSQSHITWFYPFSVLIEEPPKISEYNYFLIHLPGKSAVFHNKAEISTRNLVIEAVNGSNIIYSNGESYMLAEPFMYNLTS